MTDEDLSKQMETVIGDEIQKVKCELTRKIEEEMLTATLENVHKKFKEYYHITNTNHIDVILATALGYRMEGDPVWLIFYGASGDLKTSIVKALLGFVDVILLDNITPNTFASGKVDTKDLGFQLQNSNHILLIPDLATLISKGIDEKNEIWGQFRTLYDGYINKKTGSGVNRNYEGCHVTLIACATSLICDEVLVHAQLGTRDFMYSTGADPIDTKIKMKMAWDNVGKENVITADVRNTVQTFLKYHPIREIPVSDDMKDFIMEQAKTLMILRAGGAVDRSTRELLNPVVPEVPTRLVKQFKKLYYGLKALDTNYPDETCREIISHIVNSSGNTVRQMVLSCLQKSNPLDHWFKISDIQFATRLSRGTVKQQLETLWNMKVIEKKIEEERIGSYVYTNQYGAEEERGGHIEEVAYYRRLQA